MVDRQPGEETESQAGVANQAARPEPWANAPRPTAPSPEAPTRTGGWQSEGVHVSSSWAHADSARQHGHLLTKLLLAVLVVSAALIGGWFTIEWVMG